MKKLVISGNSGSGKTTALIAQAIFHAMNGKAVLLVSDELTETCLVDKISKQIPSIIVGDVLNNITVSSDIKLLAEPADIVCFDSNITKIENVVFNENVELIVHTKQLVR